VSVNENNRETISGILNRLDIRASPPVSTSDKRSTELDNKTFAVKDMFAVAGEIAGFGCPEWKKTHQASASNAPVVQTLLDAGAHLVANTVCDEMAFSLDGINVHYGTPLNPLAPDRIPGGSSSGPASVVAQGLVDFALGTDTAGSTRVPASYCGIWGLRPTHGAISTDGVLPLGPSFDTVGLLAGNLDTLTTCARLLLPEKNIEQPTQLILAGEAFALLHQSLLPPVMAMVDRLRSIFASSVEDSVTGESLGDFVANFAAIRSFEAWQCHKNWFEQYGNHLSAVVRQRLAACSQSTEEAMQQSVRYRLKQQIKFAQMLDGKIICLPTTAAIPPLKSASMRELDENRSLNLRLNSIASFLGLPQLHIPAHLSIYPPVSSPPELAGPSTGLSIIGAAGSDLTLLKLAAQLSSQT